MALRRTGELVRGSSKGLDRADNGQPCHSERSEESPVSTIVPYILCLVDEPGRGHIAGLRVGNSYLEERDLRNAFLIAGTQDVSTRRGNAAGY